jgi:hypothetical protein
VMTWSTALFSHLGLTATCASCHNGISAVGKPVNHVVTILDCASCHNTQSWITVLPRAPLKPLLAPTRSPTK